MKVIAHFTFEEGTLRTIHAAQGRRSVATRKDCLAFIHRAVSAALAAAPTPAPKRKRLLKVLPKPVQLLSEDAEVARAVASRDLIRRSYKV